MPIALWRLALLTLAALLALASPARATLIYSNTFSTEGILDDEAGWTFDGTNSAIFRTTGGRLAIADRTPGTMDYTLPTPVTSGTIYTSYTIQSGGTDIYTTQNTSRQFFGYQLDFSINPDDAVGAFDRDVVGLKAGGIILQSDAQFGTITNTGGVSIYGNPFPVLTIVSSFDLGTGLATLWINPTSAASPSFTSTGSPVSSITDFGFRSNNDGLLFIDNLKIGTTFADVVTAVPEPSTWTLLALSCLFLLPLSRKISRA